MREEGGGGKGEAVIGWPLKRVASARSENLLAISQFYFSMKSNANGAVLTKTPQRSSRAAAAAHGSKDSKFNASC